MLHIGSLFHVAHVVDDLAASERSEISFYTRSGARVGGAEQRADG